MFSNFGGSTRPVDAGDQGHVVGYARLHLLGLLDHNRSGRSFLYSKQDCFVAALLAVRGLDAILRALRGAGGDGLEVAGKIVFVKNPLTLYLHPACQSVISRELAYEHEDAELYNSFSTAVCSTVSVIFNSGRQGR